MTPSRMQTARIGVDVGGTFTDLVAIDEATGEITVLKGLSTPREPSNGVFALLGAYRSGHSAIITQFVHASTVGTNIFLGQIGLELPKGALLTNAGFTDVLEIGRQKRADLYDPFFKRPEPLIPRSRRFGITTRMSAIGETVKAVDQHELLQIATMIRRSGAETLAISLLNSYVDPAHEQMVKQELSRELPDLHIVASHEVDPQYREYERTSTTVVNSLLVPVVSRYLKRMAERLELTGVNAPFMVMQSNGGLARSEAASRIPAATIESGPATGVIASAFWGDMLSLDKVLSFDMGGTTAKAGAVIDGAPQMVTEYEVGGSVHGGRMISGTGYPVRYPFIDLAEVSGGGGTIAWVEGGEGLRVGPTSVGADPGPACYGRKGDQPTVTDANLLLGRLPEALSKGRIELRKDLARKAIGDHIAEPLGLSEVEGAIGILEVVDNTMMRALRLVSIERGFDARDFTMMAFGGAGPMHGPFLARGLGISEVVVPPNPGVFSAIGLIIADFRYDTIRAVMTPAVEADDEAVWELFGQMKEEAAGVLVEEGFEPDQVVISNGLELRYLGQFSEIRVPWMNSVERTISAFHGRHEELYGYASREEPVEIVNAYISAVGKVDKPDFKRKSVRDGDGDGPGKRRVHFDGGWMDAQIFTGESLPHHTEVAGPAIVEKYDSTVVIPPGWSAESDSLENIKLTWRGGS